MDLSEQSGPFLHAGDPDLDDLKKNLDHPDDYQRLYDSLIVQNTEISVLNEELTAQQDELRLQYQQLAQAEYEIRKREEQLRFITRQVPATLWVVDRHLNYLLSEGKGLSLIGLTPGEVVGQNLRDFFHVQEKNHPALEAHIRALHGEEVTFEYDHDGVIFQTSLTPMTGPDHIINGVIGIAYDITQQVKAAENIRFERERAHQYLNVAEVMILAFDRHGTITLVNRRGCEFLGLSHDQIIGKNWFDQFLPPTEWLKTREFFHEFFQGWYGESSRCKGEILTNDGSPRIIS